MSDAFGECWRWVGEGPAPDEVRANCWATGFSNCADCLGQGNTIVRVATEAEARAMQAWTHVSLCRKCLAEWRAVEAVIQPLEVPAKYWDGQGWRLVSDEANDPRLNPREREPYNVSGRMAAIFEGASA
jgi:hypothetical protein